MADIPKIPDKELDALCDLSRQYSQFPHAPKLLSILEEDFDKRMAARSYIQEEILKYLAKKCPGALIRMKIADFRKKLEEKDKPRKPLPPGPPPMGPPVATPGTISGEQFVCARCGSSYSTVREVEAHQKGCEIVPQEECSPYMRMRRRAGVPTPSVPRQPLPMQTTMVPPTGYQPSLPTPTSSVPYQVPSAPPAPQFPSIQTPVAFPQAPPAPQAESIRPAMPTGFRHPSLPGGLLTTALGPGATAIAPTAAAALPAAAMMASLGHRRRTGAI